MSNAKAILVIAALGGGAYFLFSGHNDPRRLPAQPTNVVAPLPAPALKVDLKNEKWRRGGFGSIAIFSFTIVNDNDFPVRDIEIICRFFGNSGTVIHTRREVIYETVPAKKSKSVKDLSLGFIDGQAKSASCIVDDAHRA